MRRQLVAKLLARRSSSLPTIFARRCLPSSTSHPVLSLSPGVLAWRWNGISERSYADVPSLSNGTSRTPAQRTDDTGIEADRKRIHTILFPSIPTHLIPGPIKNANLDTTRAGGLSSEEVLELVGILVKALGTLDKNVAAKEMQQESLSEASEQVEQTQAGAQLENAATVSDAAAGISASSTTLVKDKRNLPSKSRPNTRSNAKLSARYAELTDSFGPYVPHIANSLGVYIQTASSEDLEAHKTDLEKASKWCFVHSFDGSHVQGRSNQSLRDFHIAGKDREKATGSGPDTTTSVPSKTALATEKAALVRRAQSAYEQLLSRWTKKAIADRALSAEAGSAGAENILRSIEDTFERAGQQLAMIYGEGIESHVAIHQKTRQLLSGAFKERIRAPMRELLALWTRISFDFGSKDTPLRDMIPKETISLGLLKLIRGVYPDQSRIWTEAIGRSKVPAAEQIADAAEQEEETDVTGMEAYTERLVNSGYMRSQNYLRGIVRSAASRSDLELVLLLWQITKKHFEQHSPATSPDRLDTLCAFLLVLLRTMSFDPQATEVKRAVGEIFGFFPNPTPLPIYHTLLGVYGAKYATAMAKNLPGGLERRENNVMLQNLKVTWDRMKTEGVARDLEAYRLVVTGFGVHGDFDAVRNCWKDLNADQDCRRMWMEQSGASANDSFPPIDMLNVFMTTFLNSPKASGGAAIATGMFASICDPKTPYKPDIVSVNIMLRHYVANNDIESMSSLMAKLSSLGLKPDVVTYTTIVDGLLRSGKRDVAKDTLDLMQSSGVTPSSHTYGLLIGDLSRSGTREDMARADALVKRMRLAKLTPSTVTYTALLGGYFRAGMIPQALTVLKQMERDGTDMDIVTYNMVLRSIISSNVDSYAKKATKRIGGTSNTDPSGTWRTIVDAMLARRIVPNNDTWFIVLSGLHRAGRFEEGDAVIQEMERQKFVPLHGSALDRCVDAIGRRQSARPARFR